MNKSKIFFIAILYFFNLNIININASKINPSFSLLESVIGNTPPNCCSMCGHNFCNIKCNCCNTYSLKICNCQPEKDMAHGQMRTHLQKKHHIINHPNCPNTITITCPYCTNYQRTCCACTSITKIYALIEQQRHLIEAHKRSTVLQTRCGSCNVTLIINSDYEKKFSQLIEHFINEHGIFVCIACLTNDPLNSFNTKDEQAYLEHLNQCPHSNSLN